MAAMATTLPLHSVMCLVALVTAVVDDFWLVKPED